MADMERELTLSQKQRMRLKVICMYSEGRITRKKVAETLGLSERQVTRMRKEYERLGDESMIHKNSGRTPSNALCRPLKERVTEIYGLPAYEGVNHTHFKEILLDDHDIDISYTSLCRILKSSGNESPLKKRQPARRKKRKRKEHPGELIQVDASPFEWLGGNQKYSLHGAIDDATGEIVGLYMANNECLFGYFEIMRQCIEDFGVPQSLYSDMHAIFRSPKTDKLSVEELINGKTVNLTQFGRSMYELGIDIISAKSPQAKGRVEKLWATLQGRLPVEFRKRRITNTADANLFLLEYRSHFAKLFAVKPEADPLYVPFPSNASLDNFLCIKHERKVDNTCVFSFTNRAFKIDTKGYPLISKGSTVMVYISPRFGIKAEYLGNVYETVRFIKPDTKKYSTGTKPQRKRANKTLPQNQFKENLNVWRDLWVDDEREIDIQFLNDLFFSDAHRHTKRYG